MKTQQIEKVFLYNEGASKRLDIEEIASYLREKLSGGLVEVRDVSSLGCAEECGDYAWRLASIKVLDVGRKVTLGQEPLNGEVQYEKKRILGKTKAFGVIYDGFLLQRIFSELITAGERALEFVHIFLTNRLFATWEEGDRRYHLRTSVYGFPSVISTTGIVEAPAKPREYYLLKRQYEMLGKDISELTEVFRGSFIDYEDERLNEVAKGYAMQAVCYHFVGDPFCEDKGCRLYNAHWQEELIFAQLGAGYEFCESHTRLLERRPEK